MADYGILPLLGKTVKCIDIFINNNLKQSGFDLTKKQLLVLKALSSNGPLPQQNLAFITERDKASLTRFINTLEKKRLVSRIPLATDKRINMVHLTKLGEKVFQNTVPIFRKLVLQIQEDIPEQELQHLARALDKINENIEILNSGGNCG